MAKTRLDIFLIENKFFDSRNKANAEIMKGNVLVDDRVETKAGFLLRGDEKIKIKEDTLKYVGRGALKLEKVVLKFDIDFTDKVVFDIGASTGGFTDFALKNNAKKVYAIDVGYGQLDYSLREDERVVNLEKTNARYFFDEGKNADLIGAADIVLIDVSFISLKLILGTAKTLLKGETTYREKDNAGDDELKCEEKTDAENAGIIVALIKPQFEAKRNEVSKGKGIIKDEKIRERVINEVTDFAKSISLKKVGLSESPITGTKGNVEYLLLLKNDVERGKANEK